LNGLTGLSLFICLTLGVWLIGWRILRYRNLNIWIWSYVLDTLKRMRVCGTKGPIHIYFTLVDHFEPFHGGRPRDAAIQFVREWCERYPSIAEQFVDSDGNHPKHAIFYPEERYDAEIMDMISSVHKTGYFDVEVHLHHDDDTPEGVRKKLLDFTGTLFHRHGFLRKDPKTGRIIYGFIHGNWTLDNSSPDGRMCGVNNELTILEETGCYADFTLPSAPSDTQTRKINSIYYAVDDPERPKSHNSGRDVEAGTPGGRGLLMVQGPLTLNWAARKHGLFPGIENGEVDHAAKVTAQRIRNWIERAAYVKKEPSARFIKVYTHGCQDTENQAYLLSEGLSTLYSELCEQYNDSKRYVLHFVSPYEMYLSIKSFEAAVVPV
jgi:hypothetical protein